MKKFDAKMTVLKNSDTSSHPVSKLSYRGSQLTYIPTVVRYWQRSANVDIDAIRRTVATVNLRNVDQA